MDNFLEWLDGAATGSSFLIVGVISLVLLVIAFLIDGIFEAFDFGDGPLSLTTLAAFGAVFGFAGFAATGTGVEAGVATLISAVAGLLGAFGAWGLSFFFKKSSSTSSIQAEGLAGETAVVILRIPGGEALGEIALHRSGHRYTFSARAAEAIATGVKVTILSTVTDSSVMVEEYKAPQENQEPNNKEKDK